MSRPWGRLYGGTYNHRKIKILSQRLPSLWTYWYVLIDMAIEIDDEGWIYVAPDLPYTFKDLAKTMRIRREDHLKTLCKTLEELKMITISDKGILLNSFLDRNFQSDISTPRVQKYREKQKQEKSNETLHSRSRNVSETHQNRTDTEHINTSVSPNRGNGVEEKFEIWWKAYPPRRKTGKPAVKAKWLYLHKAGKLLPFEKMLEVLEAQKQSQDWIKEAGEYIPAPHPYLAQFKFLDESMMVETSRPKKHHNPSCIRCRGSGTYLSGKTKDDAPIYSPCNCDEAGDGKSKTAN